MEAHAAERPGLDSIEKKLKDLAPAPAGNKLETASGASRLLQPENSIEPAGTPIGLPVRIAGGFDGVTDELDRRARDWRNQVYLLEQQRPQLEAAEAAYAGALDGLAAVAPAIQERGRALLQNLQTAKGGDISGHLGSEFSKNAEVLEELERAAEALTANLLWVRSTWETYAKSVLRGQKMREELRK